MTVRTEATGRGLILYDDTLLSQADAALFEPGHWQEQGAVTGTAGGRGTAWFVTAPADGEWVLRHYHRGGLPGRVIRDRYLYTGMHQTRAWREWHLLYLMSQRGLPVPRPVAARICRHGLGYSADIITERVPGARPLSAFLPEQAATVPWHAVGEAIRRIHDAGVFHADLNAHNILVGADEVYIIDFDRGSLRGGVQWKAENLARLKRSLDKLAGNRNPEVEARGWPALLSAYRRDRANR